MLRRVLRWIAERWSMEPEWSVSDARRLDRDEERRLEALRLRLNQIGEELTIYDRRKRPRADCR
jgi:hypothetical protein